MLYKAGFPLFAIRRRLLRLAVSSLLLTALLGVSGCTYVTSYLTKDFTDSLGMSIIDSEDPDTIGEALPTYLLTMDAMARDSDSADTVWAAAKLNQLYASQFVTNKEQKSQLIDKAWRYGQRAACLEIKRLCNVTQLTQPELAKVVSRSRTKHASTYFYLGSLWASWIEDNSEDWNAVAKIGHVQLLMETVVALDESFENGSAHIYLGVLSSMIPSAMGGKPEEGKAHFEKAIEMTYGKNLMAKVLYAQHYARMIFDRDLHDKLLNEVLATPSQQAGFTLSNKLAKRTAEKLLESAEDYF